MKKKVLFSLLIVPFIILYVLLENNLLIEHSIDDDGEITFILLDENDNEVRNQKLKYNKEDSLYSILKKNYQISCADSSYEASACNDQHNHIVLVIEFVHTDWYTSYLALYKNGEYASYGVDDISISNGDVFIFKYTKLS